MNRQEEFAQYLTGLTDEEVATIAAHTGMDFTPDRTPAGYLALLETLAAGVLRLDRRRVVRVLRSLPTGRRVVALLVLVRRAGEGQRPAWVAGPLVRRLVPQAGHGAGAPVRGSPYRARSLCPPGAPLP